MVLKLDDKPDQDSLYDDGERRWYKPERDNLEDTYDAPSATDDDLPEGHPYRGKKSSSPDELAGAEESGDTPGATHADTAESEKFSDDENRGWYKGDGKRKVRGKFWNRKKTIGGGIAGLVIGGGIGLSVLTAPSLIVNQLRALLLNSVSELQTSQSLRYRRRYIHKVGDMFTRDGRRANKIRIEMETRGYRFNFDKSGRLLGIDLPGRRSSIPNINGAIEAHISDYMELRHPLRTSRWKTKRMESFFRRYKITRAPPVARAPDDPKDPEQAANKKVTSDIYGNEDGPRARASGEVDDDTDNPDETDAERANRQADVESVARGDGVYDDLKRKLGDGTPVSKLTDEERNLLKIGVNYDKELADLAEKAARQGLGGRALRGLKSLTFTGTTDRICVVKQRLAGAVFAARHYRALSLLRYTSSFIKIGDAARASGISGNIDPGMFNALMKRVTAIDANGNPLGASPGIAYLLKGKFSKSKNDSFKGSFGVDGKLTGFPGAAKETIDQIPGINDTSCRIAQNPLAQISEGVIQIALSAFTGTGSTAVSGGARQAFAQAFSGAIRSMFTKRGALALAGGVAVDMGFEATMSMIQLYVEKSLTLNFTGQEVGGELGQALAGGSEVSARLRNSQAGQVPATTAEYDQALAAHRAEKEQERRNESFFARTFDLDNPDSLTFQAMSRLAFSPAGNIGQSASGTMDGLAYLGGSALNLPKFAFSGLAGLLTGRVSAQANPDEISYDTLEAGGETLAVGPGGTPLTIMRSDIESIDPDENIEALTASGDLDAKKLPDGEWDSSSLEPVSDRFIDLAAYCVGGVYATEKVAGIDIYSAIDEGKDCLAKNEITKRFMAHIAYRDMLDTIDAALFPEEIAQSASVGSVVAPPDGLAWPLIQSKSEAASNLGSCLNTTSQSICAAGHPYLAHDLFAAKGTPVVAVAEGEVIKARVGTCGHGFGSAFAVQVYNSSSNITYFYQHMDPDAASVSAGDTIRAGDLIGVVGSSSAACNTEPHLHIDAVAGRGRPACSRLNCSAENKSKFIDISRELFKGYDVLSE